MKKIYLSVSALAMMGFLAMANEASASGGAGGGGGGAVTAPAPVPAPKTVCTGGSCGTHREAIGAFVPTFIITPPPPQPDPVLVP